jgi:hypothetical protein
VAMLRGFIMRMPVSLLMKMGFATFFHPRTSGWGRASKAIDEYVAERHAADARALHLDAHGAE